MTPYKQRLVVAAWGIPLLLTAVYFGGVALRLVVAAVSALAVAEGYRLLGGTSRRVMWLLVIFAASAPMLVPHGDGTRLLAFLAGGATALAVLSLSLDPPIAARSAFPALALMVYPCVFFLHFVWLRAAFGWNVMFYLFALIWIGDTAAYEGGRRTGRRKLAPSLSPNKTVEGALWALLFSLITAGAAYVVWGHGRPHVVWLAVAAVVVWFLGTAGDLFESALKRAAGVKDSSRLLQEHGGVLDRFDSLLLACVGLYYLCFWHP